MDDIYRRHVIETYSEIAQHFDRTRYLPWPEMKWYSSMLPAKSNILDVGCGNGRNTFYMASWGHSVLGVDLVPAMIEIASSKNTYDKEKVNFLQGDARNLPLEDDSMDGVVCVAAVHHIPDKVGRRTAMRECWRVLRPGGLLLLSVWAFEQERTGTFQNVDGAAEGDVLVPWNRQIDGRVFYRYYHLYTRKEFEDDISAVLDVGLVFTHENNHQVFAVKGSTSSTDILPRDLGRKNAVSL